jgi:antitoxin (DNA-binding transcriptional repressor) of toxin-antitoxin stability system
VACAASGEEVILIKDGQPIAKLVAAMPTAKKEPRKQSHALHITYMDDDFDGPLPPELLKAFGSDP